MTATGSGRPPTATILEQAPSVARQAIEPLRDHLSERERVEGPTIVAVGEVHIVTHELLDEKRTSPRLARGRAGRSLRHLVGAIEQRQGEPHGVRRVERPHGDVAHLGALGPAIAYLFEKRAGLRLLVPVSHHVENGRRIRRAHEVEEKRGAVGVAPLRVVDVEDEGLTRG